MRVIRQGTAEFLVTRSWEAVPPDAEPATPIEAARILRDISRSLLEDRLSVHRRPVRETPRPAPTAAATVSRGTAAPANSWIRFRVLDEYSRKPVANVPLALTLNDDSMTRVTDAAGEVDLRGIDPGSAGVADAPAPGFLTYAGLDEPSPPSGPDPGDSPGPGPSRIRILERHRVRTGETLAGLAAATGLNWQDIARLNRNAAEPAKVNRHLRRKFGCPKRNGANYVFDDDDRPGMILLPRPWSLAGCATDRTRVIRVRRIVRRAPIRIEDPYETTAELSVKVAHADGSTESLTTDPRGVVWVRMDRGTSAGNRVDLDFRTASRRHRIRVYVVLDPITTTPGIPPAARESGIPGVGAHALPGGARNRPERQGGRRDARGVAARVRHRGPLAGSRAARPSLPRTARSGSRTEGVEIMIVAIRSPDRGPIRRTSWPPTERRSTPITRIRKSSWPGIPGAGS